MALLQEELSSKGLVTIATDSHAVLPTLDALVTVTSAIDSVIEPEDLKTGGLLFVMSQDQGMFLRKLLR